MITIAAFTPADLAKIIALPALVLFWLGVLHLLRGGYGDIRGRKWNAASIKLVLLALIVGAGGVVGVPGLMWIDGLYESKTVFGRAMLLPAPTNRSDSEVSFTGDGRWIRVINLQDSYWTWLAVNESDLMKNYPMTWSPEWKTTKWQKTPVTDAVREITDYLGARTTSSDPAVKLLASGAEETGGYYAFSEDPKRGYLHYVQFYLITPGSKHVICVFSKT